MVEFLRQSPVFCRYLLAVASAALGDALIFIALPFLVLSLSDSPQTLATVVVLGSLPRFFGPLIGNLADRVALRRPLVVAGLLRAALFGLLAGLAIAGTLPIALIYVAALLNGLLSIFVFSASNVVVPQLVSEQQLERANSLLQGAIMGIPLLGFAVGGTLVATLGSALTVALAVPCFVGLSAVMRTLRLPRRAASGTTSFVADLAIGAKLLTSQTTFAVLLGLSLVLNAALSGLNVAVPLTMRDLGLGARGFGLFEMTLSVGMLGGIVGVGLLRGRFSLGVQVGGSSLIVASGLALMSLLDVYTLFGGAALLGFGLGMSEVAAITLLQKLIPNGQRGKVLGFVLSVNALGLAAGAYTAGLVLAATTATVVYASGSLLIGAFALVWIAYQLRRPPVPASAS